MTNIKAMGKITLEELESDIAWLNAEKAGCCHHVVAHTDAGTVLAIVVGWSDGFDAAQLVRPMPTARGVSVRRLHTSIKTMLCSATSI